MGDFATQSSRPRLPQGPPLSSLLFFGGYNSTVCSLAKGTACPDPTEQPRGCVGSPRAGSPPFTIQSHHPDAIAVLTLAPESIKHSGKVQSSGWAWQAAEEVRGGGTDPKNTSPGLQGPLVS